MTQGLILDISSHFDVSIPCFKHWYRVIQNSAPPPPFSRQDKSASEKIINALSNTTYLDIIWRVLTSGIEYLRLSESFTKFIFDVFFLLY